MGSPRPEAVPIFLQRAEGKEQGASTGLRNHGAENTEVKIKGSRGRLSRSPCKHEELNPGLSNAEGEPFLMASGGDELGLLQSSPSTADRGSAVLSRAHSCR